MSFFIGEHLRRALTYLPERTHPSLIREQTLASAYDTRSGMSWSAAPVTPTGGAMYHLVYWTGMTLFVVWCVFAAYSALGGLSFRFDPRNDFRRFPQLALCGLRPIDIALDGELRDARRHALRRDRYGDRSLMGVALVFFWSCGRYAGRWWLNP